MPKAKVAALKVRPDTILSDVEKLCELAGMKHALNASATTILKDNISWHYPFPGANTTPWQLEGTVLALRNAGYKDLSCVQNKTVVTNAFKGEDLNHYVPIFKKYGIPVLYNFRDADMTWIEYRPKAKLHVLHKIFPEGIKIPDYFFGKNIVHLPTTKCVAGNTEVVLADGSIRTIREVVGEQIARSRCVALERDGTAHTKGSVRLFAMAPDGSVRPFEATRFARTTPGGRSVLRMRTRSGRTLTATADHPICTVDGWVPLGKLEVGSRIAIARRIRVKGSSQELPCENASAEIAEITARPGRTFSVAAAQGMLDAYRAGETVTAIAANAGLRWQSVQSVLKRHGVELRRNVNGLRVPERTTEAFWRWMGYVLAEGCIERGSSDKFWWTNSDPVIRDEYIRLTRELFGLDPRCSGTKVYVYSKRLGAFFEDLGLEVPLVAGNKRVPPALFKCPDTEVAAFLSGYLDGDGHVCAKQAEISAVTKSSGLACDVQVLFSRLGLVAHVRPTRHTAPGWNEPRLYHQVVVSGPQVVAASRVLSLRHAEKSRRLLAHAERLATSKQPSNWDVAPISPETFRRVRAGLGFTQTSTGKASSVNNIENGHTHPTPRIVRHFLELFQSADCKGRFATDIAELRRVASEDLAWDSVAEIEELSADIDLYDVTVPGAECFVANGIVAHNCHIYTTTTGAMKNAFGGLLSTKRHYTHSWIHRTLVDLLAIQKEIHTGLFAVMDGTTAGNGPGPRTMYPVIKDYMLASEDQVAIDAVASKMMGFDPMSLEYIKVAHDDALGVGDPRDIEVVGADVSKENWGFEVGDNAASMVGDVMWFGALKRFQKLFFHTPLVNMFVLGSEAYHDYYRWPRKDRDTFEAWKRDTQWGRLFEAYSRGEADRIVRDAAGPEARPPAE